MSSTFLRKIGILLCLLLVLWLGMQYLLPVLLPFLLGWLLAMAAEPIVRFGSGRLHLPRPAAVGIGVCLTLMLLLGVLSVFGALAVRELGSLANILPDIQDTAQQGLHLLQQWLMGVADSTPSGIQPLLTRTVENLFGNSSALLDQATRRLPTLVSSMLGFLSRSAFSVGTGILSAFMISARLPKLRQAAKDRMPPVWTQQYLPMLHRVKSAMGGWLLAQLKLCLITYCIVTAGFLLLKIPHGPVYGALVALVDAVPILGTGTVLLPWSLIQLLRGQHLQAIGLLCIYGVAFLCRTILEPKLVGHHLGLDPLVTLLFLYAGYRFWGVPGILLAPVLAAAVKAIADSLQTS